MGIATRQFKQACRRAAKSCGRRLAAFRDQSGATAVEFAIVIIPFLMLMYGILAFALYYYTLFTLEGAIERASRIVLTGQAQQAGMKIEAFKQEVCKNGLLDCANLRVNVRQFTTFNSITVPTCTDTSGALMPNPSSYAVPGQAGAVVLITACYEWTLPQTIPFVTLGDLPNGSALLRASTTFRTEPFS